MPMQLTHQTFYFSFCIEKSSLSYLTSNIILLSQSFSTDFFFNWIAFRALNTSVTKVLLLPLVPKGGSMEPPLRKPLFHRIFAMTFAPYMYGTKKITILQKHFLNVVPFQNGGQITDFYFVLFRFWPNFEKPLSQRNFSMKFGSKKENMIRFILLK